MTVRINAQDDYIEIDGFADEATNELGVIRPTDLDSLIAQLCALRQRRDPEGYMAFVDTLIPHTTVVESSLTVRDLLGRISVVYKSMQCPHCGVLGELLPLNEIGKESPAGWVTKCCGVRVQEQTTKEHPYR